MDEIRLLYTLDDIGELLEWDEEVTMPENGLKARSRQKSAVSKLRHRVLTGERLGEILEALDRDELDREQEAVVREVEREREKMIAVPPDLMERISSKQTEAVEAWRQAREESDFEKFRPHLEEMVELMREYAAEVEPGEEPYRVLFREYEPYIGFERMENMLEELRDGLQPIIDGASGGKELDISVPEEGQKEFCRDIARDLGLGEEESRLDTSTHPFTYGNALEGRITTRFSGDPSEAALITMHEGGHALYNLGLPEEHYGSPLGAPREMSIHESQSKIWENHVARSREFWGYVTPRIKEFFPEIEASARDFYRARTRIRDDNPIRVEADELTFHLHIALRFELERELVNGELAVEDLPEQWDRKMEEYLGLRPENDSEGVLQDIHWALGAFGYFPTYSLGSAIAAQLYNAAQQEIDIEEAVARGDFSPLRDWLRENIHRHGQLYRTEELVEHATGEKPSAKYFLDYARQKYQ